MKIFVSSYGALPKLLITRRQNTIYLEVSVLLLDINIVLFLVGEKSFIFYIDLLRTRIQIM